MFVREIMSSPAVTVGPTTPVKDALVLLDEHGITAVPVTDTHNRVVGIVSEADLLRDTVRPELRARRLLLGDASEQQRRRVIDVMSLMTITVDGGADLDEAVDLMTSTAAKSLPVVDEDGRVIGVVSRSDIVHVIARSDTAIRGEVDELLRTAGTDWEVDVTDGVVTITGPVDLAERRIADMVAGSVSGVVGVQVAGSPAAR